MDFLKVISTTQAKQLLNEIFNSYELEYEGQDILSCVGRVLAVDIYAKSDVPNFNRSTVDGYAVISSNTYGSTDTLPSLLNLIGAVNMGQKTNLSISSGEAVYVPTGGMLPSRADAVCMIEYSEKLDSDTIGINKAVRVGENVTYTGDDIRKDSLLFKNGRKLSAYDIGVLASQGIATVNVYKKPKVSIISTGDEIIDINEPEEMCKVRDINGYVLKVLSEKSGCEVIAKRIVYDDFENLKSEIKKAIEQSDIVMLSGGSSVGTKDYTYDIINSLGGRGVFINGLAIKPGKPTIVGEVYGKPVFGLPGHPVSALTVYNILVDYLIKLMLKVSEKPLTIEGALSTNVHSSPGKETYQLVDIEMKDGNRTIIPIYGKSGLITTLSRAKGFMIIPDNVEGRYAGEMVSVTLI